MTHPTDREAFENWHIKCYGFAPVFGATCYEDEQADEKYEAWQAALAHRDAEDRLRKVLNT